MEGMTAPQPKTFAPSREDVLTTLSYFFGSPVSPEKLKDYRCVPARRAFRGRAFRGRAVSDSCRACVGSEHHAQVRQAKLNRLAASPFSM